jgi:hypothetical protein
MPLRLPITNTVTQADYTVSLLLGSQEMPVNLLLDTGSSVFAVDGQVYSPDMDKACLTTRIAQMVQYGSGLWVGAVARAALSLGPGTTLQNANVAITYATQNAVFGNADGILGLAYQMLDSGTLMAADSWAAKYHADQIGARPAVDVVPLFDQLCEAALTPRLFAFLVRRSLFAAAGDDARNHGLFVLGGGADCTDLYTGPFQRAAVVHEKYYNLNLLGVQVGTQPVIAVPPPAPGSLAASNAILDSGASVLELDQGLYTRVVAAFTAENAAFGQMLGDHGIDTQNPAEATAIDWNAWPDLHFIFQDDMGGQADIVLHASDYWQGDVTDDGMAIACIAGDGGRLGGQSILGLPMFTGHLVVFDRTSSTGHGVVGFAWQNARA